MKLHGLQKNLKMMNLRLRPLWDMVQNVGWNSLNTRDKKEYNKLSHRVRKLDRKINVLVRDHYNIAY